jgi:hypothetical protein
MCILQETMAGIMAFLQSGTMSTEMRKRHVHLLGSQIQNQSSSVGAGSSEVKPAYAVKKGGMGKSLRAMTRQQIQQIDSITTTYRHAFGYGLDADCSAVTITESVAEEQMMLTLKSHNDENAGTSAVGSPLDPTAASVIINETYSTRQDTDKFGRLFSDLRLSMTAQDTVPLKTR